MVSLWPPVGPATVGFRTWPRCFPERTASKGQYSRNTHHTPVALKPLPVAGRLIDLSLVRPVIFASTTRWRSSYCQEPERGPKVSDRSQAAVSRDGGIVSSRSFEMHGVLRRRLAPNEAFVREVRAQTPAPQFALLEKLAKPEEPIWYSKATTQHGCTARPSFIRSRPDVFASRGKAVARFR